ncbi:MAG: bifunctional phosphoribosylaminoimidazolecarboxamide formyltransferase/inosine monophosphate cyclohydrolase [Bacteroidia bacterium]|nr:MAG: bifunctional phosphoribosylaminoimidazolecarboxamide formyltransferase/inosine monophosphate cyclohydrolase [Bacteroidia bacterium]
MAAEPLRALLSVWHKDQVLPLAQALYNQGAELWASAGTARFLSEAGLPVHSLEALTGFTELLGGRVKTLHPQVFAGLLARPGEPLPPDWPTWNIVVVELYPFARTQEGWEELIDVGGVSLLRAAAKNYARVWAIPGPAYYDQAHADLERHQGLPPLEVRYHYAAETFAWCARYDSEIAAGFLEAPPTPATKLRYGENPHQDAYYLGALPPSIGQKALSYNNLLDLEVGWRLVQGWEKPACVILKHTQPCGAAYADSPEDAYRKAWEADPVAAYGGVVVVNFPITEAWAALTKGHFIEVLAAPAFTPEAVAWIQRHKTAVQVRLVPPAPPAWEVRSALGGYLWQKPHLADEPHPDPEVRWAARLLRALYSNAIVLVHEGQLVAAASGQTSRIEAVRLALERFRRKSLPPEKVILASDGFFPFTDSLEAIAEVGIRQVAVPPGGKRQAEIEAFAQKRYLCLTFFTYRHFRH